MNNLLLAVSLVLLFFGLGFAVLAGLSLRAGLASDRPRAHRTFMVWSVVASLGAAGILITALTSS
jgi:hypothetical protein